MLKLDELAKRIEDGESQTVEFKHSFDKETIETIVAFANTQGGIVLIGVSNDGTVSGTVIGTETIQGYTNQIKNSTEPGLIADIYELKLSGRSILIIKTDPFPVKPVGYKGKYFKRIANSNHQMNPAEIADMHLHSLQLSWDSYMSQEYDISELNDAKIEKFIARVNSSGRFRLTGTPHECLGKLNLIKNGKPTNAARLLFGSDQTLYNIHIGRFKTPTMILDDRMIRETLFEAVEETMFFILSHIKVAFEFTGEIERKEIFEYPKTALRELILNAIVHRDYTSPLDIQIKIFDQAITIYNPGRLYGNLTIEQLKTDFYQSNTRNKLIAEAFYLTKDIEKYGSGYLRVREEIKKYPTMEFKYEESGNGYLVTLQYQNQISVDSSGDALETTQESGVEAKTTQEIAQESDIEAKTTQEIGQESGIEAKTTQETIQEIAQKPETGTKEKIVKILKLNPGYTRSDLAVILNKGDATIKEHLEDLKEKGVIRRVGSTKSGHWEVIG